jgi:hypothetical protein
MNPRYAELLQRAGLRCEYCHAPAVAFNFPLEVEHIVPRAAGRDEDPGNLAVACRSCNIFKGAKFVGLDNETSESVPLFHPRKDRWDDHFEVDTDSLAVRAKTAVGRVTIELLRLNSDEQLFARGQWRRLELYP